MDGIDAKHREGTWSDAPTVRRLKAKGKKPPKSVSNLCWEKQIFTNGRKLPGGPCCHGPQDLKIPDTVYWLKGHIQSLSSAGKGHSVKKEPERDTGQGQAVCAHAGEDKGGRLGEHRKDFPTEELSLCLGLSEAGS